jgi:hypothetical protein
MGEAAPVAARRGGGSGAGRNTRRKGGAGAGHWCSARRAGVSRSVWREEGATPFMVRAGEEGWAPAVMLSRGKESRERRRQRR